MTMTSKKTILVTGATGNQGSGVIKHCLAAGHNVHALVRDPSSAKSKALETSGAVLIQGTYDDDIRSLTRAFSGVETVFYVPVNSPKGLHGREFDIQRSRNVINAARLSGSVKQFIVSTSIRTGQHSKLPGWGEQHPMYDYWLTKHAIEELVRSAGFESWTILRPAHFLQNLCLPVREFIFSGFNKNDKVPVLRTAWKAETKIAWIDVGDEGRVVVAALADPDKFHGREIDLAVEVLTPFELAAKIGRVLGKEVKVHHYTEKEQEELLKAASPIIAGQRWANDVSAEMGDVTDAGRDFELTSVDEFLRNQEQF
ncbi:hypothetical protein QBC43DRAFT_317936 [Cladorrhinum sp. PSN259]|nr:hypothetical protein QBC43DRAFT_317936 [Cladorrhinum sp. PSN259]